MRAVSGTANICTCSQHTQVSFEVQGDLWSTARFIDNLKIPYIAPSLGGVESLIEMPAVQSYWSFGPEGRAKIGIKENLVRVFCVCCFTLPACLCVLI